jgi:hypothetical protein
LIALNSHGQPAALEALHCGPSKDSEKRYFGAKSIRSLEKIQILALKMAILQKCGPRADSGWPWLALINIFFKNTELKCSCLVLLKSILKFQ